MRRPALLSAALFCAGIIVRIHLPCPIVPLLAIGGTCWGCILVCLLAKRDGPGITLGLSALLAVIGGIRYDLRTQYLPLHHPRRILAEGGAEVFGRVCDEPVHTGENQQFVLDVFELTLADTIWHVRGRIQVFYRRHSPAFDYGDTARIAVTLRLPAPARNPGAFDYRGFLRRKGIYQVGYLRAPEDIMWHTRGKPSDIGWVSSPVKQVIQAAIEQNLSGAPAGLLKGILLGQRRAVPDAISQAFARSGVNHVLAVSGLHVGLIAGVVFFSLKLIGIARRLTAVITCASLVLYALVTGLPPSAVRACIMGCMVLLGMVVGREIDSGNALGTAALGLLIAQPEGVLDVGFQLSFAATGGILLLRQPIRMGFPVGASAFWGRWVFDPLAVSLAAQVATMPFVVSHFGLVSLIGPIANLIVVPLIGAGAALGVLASLLSMVSQTLVTALNGANWVVLQAAITVGKFLAQPEWSAISVSPPSMVFWVIYTGFCALLLPQMRGGCAGKYLLIACLILANGLVWRPVFSRQTDLEVHVVDVGQGDAILLRFPGGATMLVDGGMRSRRFDVGERVLVPYLRHLGVSRIDVVVASHAHNDHIGGLFSVLESMEVGYFLDGGQHHARGEGGRLRKLARDRGVVYRAISAGDSLLGLGQGGALVLHPNPRFVSTDSVAPDGLNNGSVVLRVVCDGRAILLTGDVERETDPDLLRWGERLRADVLKSAHHGSNTSSSAAFLTGVGPSIVTISCGVGNKFGHPDKETLARYKANGIKIYRTDQSGAIRVAMGRQRISVCTQLGE